MKTASHLQDGKAVSANLNTSLHYAHLERTVRQAARALGRHGLVHAYGHCSQRLDSNSFLVCAPKPMATIGTNDKGSVVSLDGDLPPGVLGEVRIHREIYRRRPDVGGIVRSMPPKVMSLSALGRTPRRLHGMGAYFVPEIPLWDDPQLIRDDTSAEQLAQLIAANTALVMRGNGAIVAAPSLEEAVVLTWYLEDAARIEIDCLPEANLAQELSQDEARQRATKSGRIFERMWDYLTYMDPE